MMNNDKPSTDSESVFAESKICEESAHEDVLIQKIKSNVKIRFGLWLINKGVSLLPKSYRTKCFINNCIATKIIKL